LGVGGKGRREEGKKGRVEEKVEEKGKVRGKRERERAMGEESPTARA
jgi:hypothetical protein